MLKVEESLLTCVPVEKATKPFDGGVVLCDRWWIVREECVLFFRGVSPQCNANESITLRLRDRLYPGADVRFLPTVYVSQDSRM